MTKIEAMEALGVETQREMAKVLGLTQQAVYQWPNILPSFAETRVLAELYRRRNFGGGGRDE